MTDRQQSVFYFLIVFLFACGAGLLVYRQYADYYQQKTEIDLEAAAAPAALPKPKAPTVLADGRLQVDSPKEGDTVGQTFTVSGFAQGWFEGNIAIKVFDGNSQLLYQGNAIAGDNYTRPAPFQTSATLAATPTTAAGKIEFNDYSAKDGSLIYQKVVNIKFSSFSSPLTGEVGGGDISGWKTYINQQYGFELRFPPKWAAMKVEKDGLSFDLPYADTKEYSFVCGVQVFTQKVWSDLKNSDGPHPFMEIDEKNGMVYAYDCGQDDEGFVGFEDYNNAVKTTGYRNGDGPYKEFSDMVIGGFKFTK